MRCDSMEPPGQVELGGVIRDNNNNDKEKVQASLEVSYVCDMSYTVLGLTP